MSTYGAPSNLYCKQHGVYLCCGIGRSITDTAASMNKNTEAPWIEAKVGEPFLIPVKPGFSFEPERRRIAQRIRFWIKKHRQDCTAQILTVDGGLEVTLLKRES